ncbi:Fumarylacetoacetate hydrolase family protein [metagenome]|uniref:Fumarylacetoacetate hydrolase family protein n=1 Tax=metagenome TaxID=256318 RepID=A0A2P2C2C8_9ZZZZ
MRLASIWHGGAERPALVDPGRGVVLLTSLGCSAESVIDLIEEPAAYAECVALARGAADKVFVPTAEVSFTAPYRRPHKIWGIGLNYRDHAADLSEDVPDQPASFIKGDHTIAGQRDAIVIPRQSERTTVEAELGLVIGRTCRDVDEDAALDYVWGVTTVLDQTAEDILRLNPRYLTRAKNFPTFFCFGPEIVPLREALDAFGSLADVEVTTVVNDSETRTNSVANMTHGPASLVAFHSQMMPLFPGDIISTGTPGAIVVGDGDRVECRIPGIGSLRTTVVRQS